MDEDRTIRQVKLERVSKSFPGGALACDEVNLSATAGEVHAVLGENGAGKTTLMRVLAGLTRPTSGSVVLDSIPVRFKGPLDAKRAGVGMVHQHFSLVPALTVGENLALSHVARGLLFRPGSWNRHVARRASELGFSIRPDALVRDLSLGEQQRVEIFRLVLEGARILILDEPTSILAPREAEILFGHVRRFVAAGHIVFLVTHKIRHVRALADRVSVLRRGRLTATRPAGELSDKELAELMVGRAAEVVLRGQISRDRSNTTFGDVLTVDHLSVEPRICPQGLVDTSFRLGRGEILGVAGISGNGQDELVAALTGMARARGSVRYSYTSNGAFDRTNVGVIPADRSGKGIAGTLSAKENLALLRYRRPPLSDKNLLQAREIHRLAEAKMEEYDIRPRTPSAAARTFSGGNIQKLVLARELAASAGLIIAVNPTAGLDVATVDLVHRELVEMADEGTGVLLVTEDLDELFRLCDRIMVLRSGASQGVFKTSETSRGELGLLMSDGEAPPVAAPDGGVGGQVEHAY